MNPSRLSRVDCRLPAVGGESRFDGGCESIARWNGAGIPAAGYRGQRLVDHGPWGSERQAGLRFAGERQRALSFTPNEK